MQKGILIVVSGFSGAGKGTLMNKLMEEYKEEYALSVSATTRAPRPGEIDKVHYFFIGKEEFESMIQQDELIEYAQYVDNYYGTPRKFVFDQLQRGRNVILEIEIQGALKIREKFPDTRLLFICAPSAEELKKRLMGRGTETQEVIAKRLSRAYEESLGIEEYDYLIVNDDLEETTRRIHEIITNERDGKQESNSAHFMQNNLAFVNNMREQLLSFSKGE